MIGYLQIIEINGIEFLKEERYFENVFFLLEKPENIWWAIREPKNNNREKSFWFWSDGSDVGSRIWIPERKKYIQPVSEDVFWRLVKLRTFE
jgi:hypothetical protein